MSGLQGNTVPWSSGAFSRVDKLANDKPSVKKNNLMPINRSSLYPAIGMGAVATVAWMLFASHLGIDLADEGYFWYGSQRLLHGEFPIRDFMSYDPGRYLFTSLIMRILGDSGLIAVRVASALVLFCSITCAVFLVTSSARNSKNCKAHPLYYGVVIAVLFTLWMYPYYKVFEQVSAVSLVLGVYFVFLKRTSWAWFVLGTIVGLVAVIGRNHGVYGAFVTVIAYLALRWKGDDRGASLKVLGAWAIGVIVGYLPVEFAILFVDGFLHEYVAGILEQILRGETNIPLPIPWPWTVDTRHDGVVLSLPAIALGIGFVTCAAVPIFAAFYLFRAKLVDKSNALFIAALSVCIPYVHYAFSRADLTHLVPAFFPFAIMAFSIPIRRQFAATAGATVILFGFSIAVLFDTPIVNYWWTRGAEWKQVQIRNDSIYVPEFQRERILRRLMIVEPYASKEGSFLALPDMPTIHAIFETRMPVHDIYVGLPTSEEAEDAEVVRLIAAKPRLVLISEAGLDGVPAFRFSALRPKIYRWITENYRRSLMSDPRGEDVLEVFRLVDEHP